MAGTDCWNGRQGNRNEVYTSDLVAKSLRLNRYASERNSACSHAGAGAGCPQSLLLVVAMIEWFDDLKVGTRFRGGNAEVTRDDIKRFAAEFDPQPFHL